MAKMIAMLMMVCAFACGGAGGVAADREIVDCRAAPQDAIIALVVELAPVLTLDAPDWSALLQRCAAAGKVIGGCTLAMIVEGYRWPAEMQADGLVRHTGDVIAERVRADAALERFRTQHASGAVFRTSRGDL